MSEIEQQYYMTLPSGEETPAMPLYDDDGDYIGSYLPAHEFAVNPDGMPVDISSGEQSRMG